MSATEKAKPTHPMIVLREHFEARAGELKNALPAHILPERFIRVALTAVQLNTDLLSCNRQSLWNACLKAASDGLLPDGREGAIVPFKDTAQWMPMVGGLLKRFRNSGQFKSISVGIVREGEDFAYWIDEHGEHMRHVPGDGSGKPVKCWAMAETKDGGVMIRVMNEAEINKRRNASRAKNSPLWSEWVEEAWQKTVLRNLAKRLPMSSDLDDLIRSDDDQYDFKPTAAETLAQTSAPITNVVEALERFGSPDQTLTEGAEYEESTAPPVEYRSVESHIEVMNETEIDKRKNTAPELSVEEYKAWEQGREAKRAGHLRKAVPGEYRSVEMSHLAKLWWQGWDDQAEK
jgi:recombination protein RecT